MPTGPTTADLVALAAKRGIAVTPRQVERWRNARLIAPSVRHGRGQGMGTRWTYDGDAAARFLTTAQLVVVEHCSIAEAAVRLWLEGFGMEAELRRGHLRRAVAPLRALRARVTGWDPEEAGHTMLEGLRRRPAKRAQYGVRAWNDAERDGVAAFAENLVASYQHPERGLGADTVRRAKTFVRLKPEDDARLKAAGDDMDGLLQRAHPLVVALDAIVEDVTDQELLVGRALYRHLRDNPEAVREVLAREGAPGAFASQTVATLNGTFGLLLLITVVRHCQLLSGLSA